MSAGIVSRVVVSDAGVGAAVRFSQRDARTFSRPEAEAGDRRIVAEADARVTIRMPREPCLASRRRF